MSYEGTKRVTDTKVILYEGCVQIANGPGRPVKSLTQARAAEGSTTKYTAEAWRMHGSTFVTNIIQWSQQVTRHWHFRG